MIPGIYYQHLKFWINAQILISELSRIMHYTEREEERGRWGQLAKSCLLVPHFPRSPAWKVHSLTNAFFSVFVIISLNIISVLQPTAAWFKGSLVSWPRARLTYTHQHPSPLSFPFSHSVLLSLSLSLGHSPALPVLPQADWSQEGATFLNSGEDWVTQSQHQALCVTQLCCFSLLQSAMIQMEF